MLQKTNCGGIHICGQTTVSMALPCLPGIMLLARSTVYDGFLDLQSATVKERKPENIEEYIRWLARLSPRPVGRVAENYYAMVVREIKRQVEESQHWKDLTNGRLQEFSDEYQIKLKYPLFSVPPSPVILTKPFRSCLEKSYRINVLNNHKWPTPPEGGWVLQANWPSKFKDIVRTFVTVKYLDGVRHLSDQIKAYSLSVGRKCEVSLEARVDGYYAAHLNIFFECEIPGRDWNTSKTSVSLELQVTTQLQEVIRMMLHKHYEASRLNPAGSDRNWQWEYDRDGFKASYMGHILHYLEALIVDIRDKEKGSTR